jgi:tRNA (guanine10-N2)-methyltransferase
VGRKTKNKIKGIEKIEKFDAFTNFDYYGIPQPDFWVQDITQPMIRNDRPLFDAIVCDPPYGVRARS